MTTCEGFHPVTEVTAKALSERRTGCLRDLAARIGRAKSVEDVLALAAKVVEEHSADVPFAFLYRTEAGGGAPLCNKFILGWQNEGLPRHESQQDRSQG